MWIAQFYMIWYIVVWSDKDNAPTYAWSVMGLAAKLAQIVSHLLISVSVFHLHHYLTAGPSYVGYLYHTSTGH